MKVLILAMFIAAGGDNYKVLEHVTHYLDAFYAGDAAKVWEVVKVYKTPPYASIDDIQDMFDSKKEFSDYAIMDGNIPILGKAKVMEEKYLAVNCRKDETAYIGIYMYVCYAPVEQYLYFKYPESAKEAVIKRSLALKLYISMQDVDGEENFITFHDSVVLLDAEIVRKTSL